MDARFQKIIDHMYRQSGIPEAITESIVHGGRVVMVRSEDGKITAEAVPDFLKPHVSDTARAAVAERFAYLPANAAEIAAGYLTLIENVDAKHKQSANPDVDYATAVEMSRQFEHLPPWKQEQMRRAWLDEREHFTRAFANFLAIYPQSMFIRIDEKSPLSRSQAGQ